MRIPKTLRRLIPNADLGLGVIRKAWNTLSPLPGGKALFSTMVGRMAPYTGSISAEVVELREGYAKVEMQDRRHLRNHLRSVHAVALVNLAELTGNVALAYSMPANARFIVAGLQISYIKKARGTIIATSQCPVPTSSERAEYDVPVEMRDLSGDVVATAVLSSLVGPVRRKSADGADKAA